MTNEKELVFDPFAGVASSGVAAILNNRRFWGCEIVDDYIRIGKERLIQSIEGNVKHRENKPLYNPNKKLVPCRNWPGNEFSGPGGGEFSISDTKDITKINFEPIRDGYVGQIENDLLQRYDWNGKKWV